MSQSTIYLDIPLVVLLQLPVTPVRSSKSQNCNSYFVYLESLDYFLLSRKKTLTFALKDLPLQKREFSRFGAANKFQRVAMRGSYQPPAVL